MFANLDSSECWDLGKTLQGFQWKGCGKRNVNKREYFDVFCLYIESKTQSSLLNGGDAAVKEHHNIWHQKKSWNRRCSANIPIWEFVTNAILLYTLNGWRNGSQFSISFSPFPPASLLPPAFTPASPSPSTASAVCKSCKAVSQQLPVAQALITALHLRGKGHSSGHRVRWCYGMLSKGTWCDPLKGHCLCLKIHFFRWRKCSKLFPSTLCITSCYVCHFASAVAKTKPQCRKHLLLPPSSMMNQGHGPMTRAFTPQNLKSWLKLCNVCHLQTFSRSSEQLWFRTPWSPRSSSWYPASMSLPTDGVLEIQVVELNTKIRRNGLLTLFTSQRRNHNSLKEVHAPTARFVSTHPPQESLSNQRQKKHL